MFLATCVVALFCFIPASSLAPPNCEDLVRPLDHVDGHQLDGRWFLIAYGLVEPEPLGGNYMVQSWVIEISNASYTSNTSNLLFERNLRFVNRCEYQSFNITLEGNVLSEGKVSSTLIHTSCSDCLLMHTAKGVEANLHLFSKRREVEKEVMDEFKTQAECLNSQLPVMMDPSKKLCPDQKPTLPETEDLAEKLKTVENEAPDA
ncbi:hypothetical protein L3Q82_005413 [Xyrichtys novacula]|uniref:Apolipoprotein M n=1 Tax=Xyrichtys novacula TaxID=13765 RepID=A0AAV1EY07_XYRNO|nr:hypothetical protein L3Q82_005413 [Xyrichtys novacula]